VGLDEHAGRRSALHKGSSPRFSGRSPAPLRYCRRHPNASPQ
jgi:hypothetical protein